MLTICHRGYHRTEHENTLEAFRRARAIGAHGVETDVRLSADRLPILFHDRVARGSAVASLTRAELSRMVGYDVPTLDEAMAQDAGLLWNVEIKTQDAVTTAIRTLTPYLNTRRLLVTSFWHDIVARVANELPVECGVLVDHRPYDIASFLRGIPRPATLTTVVWDYETMDVEVLRAVTEAGLRNAAYGAVTEHEHQRCGELGLAALITDFPHLLEGGMNHEPERHAAT